MEYVHVRSHKDCEGLSLDKIDPVSYFQPMQYHIKQITVPRQLSRTPVLSNKKGIKENRSLELLSDGKKPESSKLVAGHFLRSKFQPMTESLMVEPRTHQTVPEYGLICGDQASPELFY
jgi:hypothetical protein